MRSRLALILSTAVVATAACKPPHDASSDKPSATPITAPSPLPTATAFDSCSSSATRAFLNDLYKQSTGQDGTQLSDAALDAALAPRFALPEVDPLLFGLLDSGLADFTAWPSLGGLSIEDRRVLILGGVLALSPGFTADCALLHRLAKGPSRSVADVALTVNLSHARPLTDAAVLATPFTKRNLVFEIARALDTGLGRPGGEVNLVSTPKSVEADPVAQVLVAVRGGHMAWITPSDKAWRYGAKEPWPFRALLLLLGPPPAGSGVVGAAGGTISVGSGPLAGAELDILPGALTSAMAILILSAPDAPAMDALSIKVGPAAKLEPDGLALAIPANLTLPFDPRLASLVYAKALDTATRHYPSPSGPWIILNTAVNVPGSTTTAPITSFSYYDDAVNAAPDLVLDTLQPPSSSWIAVDQAWAKGDGLYLTAAPAGNNLFIGGNEIHRLAGGSDQIVDTSFLGLGYQRQLTALATTIDPASGFTELVYGTVDYVVTVGPPCGPGCQRSVQACTGRIWKQSIDPFTGKAGAPTLIAGQDYNSTAAEILGADLKCVSGLAVDSTGRMFVSEYEYVPWLNPPPYEYVAQAGKIVLLNESTSTSAPVAGSFAPPSSAPSCSGTNWCSDDGPISCDANGECGGDLWVPLDLSSSPVSMDGDALFVADAGNNRVRVINVDANGRTVNVAGISIPPNNIATLVGNGPQESFCSDATLCAKSNGGTGLGGPGYGVSLGFPTSVELVHDAAGGGDELLIAESLGNRLLVQDLSAGSATAGYVACLSGDQYGGSGGTSDGMGATGAYLTAPSGIALEQDDPRNARLHFIDNASSRLVKLVDTDGDGVPDRYDNCPTVANSDQANEDGDGQGDACDCDKDNDGIPNANPSNPNCPSPTLPVCGNGQVSGCLDNCPDTPNADQRDTDYLTEVASNGKKAVQGDACDDDIDGDGLSNADESKYGLDLFRADSNGDGNSDLVDYSNGAFWVGGAVGGKPIDTDGDGLPDFDESATIDTDYSAELAAAQAAGQPPPAPTPDRFDATDKRPRLVPLWLVKANWTLHVDDTGTNRGVACGVDHACRHETFSFEARFGVVDNFVSPSFQTYSSYLAAGLLNTSVNPGAPGPMPAWHFPDNSNLAALVRSFKCDTMDRTVNVTPTCKMRTREWCSHSVANGFVGPDGMNHSVDVSPYGSADPRLYFLNPFPDESPPTQNYRDEILQQVTCSLNCSPSDCTPSYGVVAQTPTASVPGQANQVSGTVVGLIGNASNAAINSTLRQRFAVIDSDLKSATAFDGGAVYPALSPADGSPSALVELHFTPIRVLMSDTPGEVAGTPLLPEVSVPPIGAPEPPPWQLSIEPASWEGKNLTFQPRVQLFSVTNYPGYAINAAFGGSNVTTDPRDQGCDAQVSANNTNWLVTPPDYQPGILCAGPTPPATAESCVPAAQRQCTYVNETSRACPCQQADATTFAATNSFHLEVDDFAAYSELQPRLLALNVDGSPVVRSFGVDSPPGFIVGQPIIERYATFPLDRGNAPSCNDPTITAAKTGDKIADCGWRALSGSKATTISVEDVGLADEDIDAPTPPFAAAAVGDGFTRFEEYRGAMVLGTHRRFDPDTMDIFASYAIDSASYPANSVPAIFGPGDEAALSDFGVLVWQIDASVRHEAIACGSTPNTDTCVNWTTGGNTLSPWQSAVDMHRKYCYDANQDQICDPCTIDAAGTCIYVEGFTGPPNVLTSLDQSYDSTTYDWDITQTCLGVGDDAVNHEVRVASVEGHELGHSIDMPERSAANGDIMNSPDPSFCTATPPSAYDATDVSRVNLH